MTCATLCLPDRFKSCFRCCPPIRSPGYDHLAYRSILARELRDNTRAYHRSGPCFRPIVGYTCWALGYLDEGYRQVGCLLHPARNQGKDLRGLIDYGDKCRLALCKEAAVFQALSPRHRGFWLHMCRDMDSFTYSSPEANPLFRILGWGPGILGSVAEAEPEPFADVGHLYENYPFMNLPHPETARYFAEQASNALGIRSLKGADFRERLQGFRRAQVRTYKGLDAVETGAPFVHRLPLDGAFGDFLRLGLGVRRMRLEKARAVKERVDRAACTFHLRLGSGMPSAPLARIAAGAFPEQGLQERAVSKSGFEDGFSALTSQPV